MGFDFLIKVKPFFIYTTSHSQKPSQHTIPTTIPVMERLNNEMPKGKIAVSLVKTYVKNNWKVMLTCTILGGTLIYVLYKIDEENQKRNAKK